MPDEAVGSNGVRLSFSSSGDIYELNLLPGDYRELIIDFRNPSNQLTVVAKSNGSSFRDWIYIMDGWIVPTAPRLYDFLANARQASWRTGRGRLTFNRQGEPSGEVSLRGWMKLHTGKLMEPKFYLHIQIGVILGGLKEDIPQSLYLILVQC